MCATRHFALRLSRLKKQTRQIINSGNMLPDPLDHLWRNNLTHIHTTATVRTPQTAISKEIAVFAVFPAIAAQHRIAVFAVFAVS